MEYSSEAFISKAVSARSSGKRSLCSFKVFLFLKDAKKKSVILKKLHCLNLNEII